MAIGFLAFLQYLPGEGNTNQGAMLNSSTYRTFVLGSACFILALHRVDLSSIGATITVFLSFIGIEFGSHVLFMIFFYSLSKYHQLFLRDTRFDVHVFGYLVPTGVVFPFLWFWTDMNEQALCRFMLPLHIWLAVITFPAVMVWFHFSGFLEKSFHVHFSDSCVLGLLHNAYGPTAMPLLYFVPLQIVAFAAVSFVASATCGALELFSRADFMLLTVPIVLGLMLFVARAAQDAIAPDNEAKALV